MKLKFQEWWRWATTRPTVLVNVIGILIIVVGFVSYFIYQQTRDLDVLKDWNISTVPTETRQIDGVPVAVYHPGDSLIFTSNSVKLTDAKGTTSRMIVCEATENQARREIQLDALPAVRPPGVNGPAENAIVLPDVSQYQGLPRWCVLSIDIVYDNVYNTGRSWSEHAQTTPFIVEENALNPTEIRKQIKELTDKITELEGKLPTGTTSSSTTVTNPVNPPRTTTNNTTTNNTTTNNNTTTTPPPAEDRPGDRPGFLRGILNGVTGLLLP